MNLTHSKNSHFLMKLVQVKRSGDPGPEGGTWAPIPEGSLTLVSKLLFVVANIGLDILGEFT